MSFPRRNGRGRGRDGLSAKKDEDEEATVEGDGLWMAWRMRKRNG